MRSKGSLVLLVSLASPALALDVLVGDRSGIIDQVQRYDGFTGAFVDIFADSSSGLDAPRGMTVGPDKSIYVSSYASNEVIRYNAVTGAKIDTFVIAGSGGLSGPQGLTFSPHDGNLYVSSRNTHSVKRYQGPNGASPGAYIDDFVTSGSGGLNQPSGLAFGKDVWPPENPTLTPHRDGLGELLVCSWATNSVKWYNGVTGEYIKDYVSAGHAGLANPADLIFDPGPLGAADLLISSYGSNMILRVSGTCSTTDGCGSWGYAFTPANSVNQPYGLAYGPDASGDNAPELLVANTGDNTVKRFRGPKGTGGGTFMGNFITGLTQPGPLLVSCDGEPPAVPMAVVHDTGLAGLGAPAPHTLQVTGTNLGNLTNMKLVRSQLGSQQITATGFQVIDESTVAATFDLAQAEAGRYDVVAVDPCGLATPLRKAFLVYLPEPTNTSFEEGWTADASTGEFCDNVKSEWDGGNGNRPRPKHWDLGPVQNLSQFDLKRDGNIWVICSGGVAVGRTGLHFGSLQANTAGEAYCGTFQTFAAPSVEAGVSTAEYRLFADFAVKSILGISTGRMRLLDGTENGTLIAETEIPFTPEDGLVSNQLFSVAVPSGYVYASDPPILTLEIRLNAVQGDTGAHSLKAVHFDNVRTKFIVSCNTPWADADGDGDVDSADFAVFQRCYNGLEGEPVGEPAAECQCFDQPVPPATLPDGQIDLADLASFVNCSTGPDIPWSQDLTPNCVP